MVSQIITFMVGILLLLWLVIYHIYSWFLLLLWWVLHLWLTFITVMVSITIKNLSVLLTGNSTTLVLIHYFWTRFDVILWGGGIKFSSWLEMSWRGKGIATTFGNLLIIWLPQCVQQDETGTHRWSQGF